MYGTHSPIGRYDVCLENVVRRRIFFGASNKFN